MPIKSTAPIVQRALRYAITRSDRRQPFHVSLFGGEPLLAQTTVERAVKAFLRAVDNGHWPAVSFSVTTNGTLWTDSLDRLFRSVTLRQIQVTIDGQEQIHDTLRPLKSGRSAFETLWANLPRMLNASQRLVVRYNLQPDNIDDMIPLFERLFALPDSNKMDVYLSRLYEEPANDRVSQAEELFFRWYYRTTGRIHKHLRPKRRFLSCLSILRAPQWIDPQGTFFTCQHGPDLVQLGTTTTSAQLRTQQTVWHEERCVRCRFLAMCGGPCPASRVGQDDTGCTALFQERMRIFGELSLGSKTDQGT